MNALGQAFLHYTGSNNPSGPWYGFWSGFAGDLPLFGIFIVLARKHNCHYPGCWRIQVRAHGDRVYCRRHHTLVSSS